MEEEIGEVGAGLIRLDEMLPMPRTRSGFRTRHGVPGGRLGAAVIVGRNKSAADNRKSNAIGIHHGSDARRVMTGHHEDGAARIMIDDRRSPIGIARGDAEFALVWTTSQVLANNNDDVDGAMREAGQHDAPVAGGHCRPARHEPSLAKSEPVRMVPHRLHPDRGDPGAHGGRGAGGNSSIGEFRSGALRMPSAVGEVGRLK